MSNKLVFIGGAPGIGKSTVTGLLLKKLENSVWLDGDDVGRTTDHSLAIDRLNQTKSVKSEKIDTADKTPVELAEILKYKILS